MKLPNVDEELILELLGIAHTNDTAASIPGGDIKIRLAFPTSAMFSHDCLPNVVRHIGRYGNTGCGVFERGIQN